MTGVYRGPVLDHFMKTTQELHVHMCDHLHVRPVVDHFTMQGEASQEQGGSQTGRRSQGKKARKMSSPKTPVGQNKSWTKQKLDKKLEIRPRKWVSKIRHFAVMMFFWLF